MARTWDGDPCEGHPLVTSPGPATVHDVTVGRDVDKAHFVTGAWGTHTHPHVQKDGQKTRANACTAWRTASARRAVWVRHDTAHCHVPMARWVDWLQHRSAGSKCRSPITSLNRSSSPSRRAATPCNSAKPSPLTAGRIPYAHGAKLPTSSPQRRQTHSRRSGTSRHTRDDFPTSRPAEAQSLACVWMCGSVGL